MVDLKQRRKELGLTMLDVAKLVGVSEATISRYESGDIKNMGQNRIAKYAKALQVHPSDLIDDAEGTENKKYASINTDKSVEELLKTKATESEWDIILKKLTQENKDFLQKQAELLLLEQQVQVDKEEK